MEDNFWEVQKIWASKNDPVTFGRPVCDTKGSEFGNLKAATDGDLGERLLRVLGERGSFDSYELSLELGKDHQLVVGAIKSVQSLGEVSLLHWYWCSVTLYLFSIEGTALLWLV